MPQSIQDQWRQLSPELKQQCADALSRDPDWQAALASSHAPDYVPAELLLGQPYQLGPIQIAPPGPAWWDRMQRLRLALVGDTSQLTDEDLAIAGYLLVEPGTMHHMTGYERALGVINATLADNPIAAADATLALDARTYCRIAQAAQDWVTSLEAHGLALQDVANLVIQIMREQAAPCVTSPPPDETQKKTVG